MDRTSSSRLSTESGSESACSCHTTSRLSQNERIQEAIGILKHGRLSFLTALIKILDPSEESFSAYRAQLYASTKDQPTGKLAKLLDRIWDDPRGRSQLVSWMDPHATNQVTRRVSSEMDDIKGALQGRISSITPDALINWDMASTITETIAKHAPVLTEILHAAAQTKRANRENTTKDCSTVRLSRLASNLFSYLYIDFASRHVMQ